MAYQELRKLYYKDPTIYKETYAARLSSEDTVLLDFYVGEKQAFFVQNTDVLKLALQIERIDKEVRSLGAKLPGVAKKQYSRKCLIDEIVLTNKIEGVHSSRKEIGDVLETLEERSVKVGKKRRFHGLVNKYLKLMIHEPVTLDSCADVRAIYDELFLNEVISEDPMHAPDGKIFRKELSEVRSAADKVIHRGLMPESRIIEAMEQALRFLRDGSIDLLSRLCIFHYMIEYIHPFYDGNGRLGRFIVSYYLTESLDPLLAYRISETIKENIKAYYEAFEICNDPRNLGDLTPFLLMMLRMIHSAIQELKGSLARRLERWSRYEKLVQSFEEVGENLKLMQLYSVLLQASLFSERGISMRELQETLSMSYNTIKKLLGQIDERKLLCVSESMKPKYYEICLDRLDDILFSE